MLHKLRIAGVAIAIAGSFAAGFQVAAWRAGARDARELEVTNRAWQARAAEFERRIAEDNAATAAREADLLIVLEAERSQSEALRREIQDRPVIRHTVSVPVAGECLAQPVIDWGVLSRLYNAAATGSAPTGATDGGNAVLPAGAADAP